MKTTCSQFVCIVMIMKGWSPAFPTSKKHSMGRRSHRSGRKNLRCQRHRSRVKTAKVPVLLCIFQRSNIIAHKPDRSDIPTQEPYNIRRAIVVAEALGRGVNRTCETSNDAGLIGSKQRRRVRGSDRKGLSLIDELSGVWSRNHLDVVGAFVQAELHGVAVGNVGPRVNVIL